MTPLTLASATLCDVSQGQAEHKFYAKYALNLALFFILVSSIGLH
jgi:hypothetical protein